MKRIALGIVGLGLLAGTAYAKDDVKAEDKIEVKDHKDHKKIEKKKVRGRHMSKTTVESKSKKRLGGGRVDTTETTTETDRPGMGNDTKHKTTHTKERDSNGNVVREEVKHD